uniref:DUF4201 domain-containing protein n=1 Tax=Parastrongyloides trichosuri TaxID=131310 RepID=A0A0N5A5K2_PARTI
MDVKELPLKEREELCYERLSTLREKKARIENGIKHVASTKIDNCSKEVTDSVMEMKKKLEDSLKLLNKQENEYLLMLAHVKTMKKIKDEEEKKNNNVENEEEVTIKDVEEELKNIKDAMDKTETASKINEQLMMRLKLQQQKRAALAGINLKKRQEQNIEADQATAEFLTAKKKFLTQKTEIERKNIQLEKLRREIVKRELYGVTGNNIEITYNNNDQHNDVKNNIIVIENEKINEPDDSENLVMIDGKNINEEDEEDDEYSHLSLSEMKERQSGLRKLLVIDRVKRGKFILFLDYEDILTNVFVKRDAFNEQITTRLRLLEANKNRMRLIREKLLGLQKESYKNMSLDSSSNNINKKIDIDNNKISDNKRSGSFSCDKEKIDTDYEDALSRLQSLTSMRQRLELIHQNMTEDGILDKDTEKNLNVPDIILSEINEAISSNKEVMDNYNFDNCIEKNYNNKGEGNEVNSPSPDAAIPGFVTNALDDLYLGGKDIQKGLTSTESSFDVTTIENVIKKGSVIENDKKLDNNDVGNEDESELISVVRKTFHDSMKGKSLNSSKHQHGGFSTSFSTIDTSQDLSKDKTPIGDISNINEQLAKLEEVLNMHSMMLEEISKQLNDTFDVKEMPLFKNRSPIMGKNSTYWSHGYWDNSEEREEGLDFYDALRQSQYDNCVNNETTKLSKKKTREKVLKFTSSLRKSSSDEFTTTTTTNSGDSDSRNDDKNEDNKKIKKKHQECSVVEEQIFFIISSIIPFLNAQQESSSTADLRFIAEYDFYLHIIFIYIKIIYIIACH